VAPVEVDMPVDQAQPAGQSNGVASDTSSGSASATQPEPKPAANEQQREGPGVPRTSAPQTAISEKADNGTFMSLDAVRNIPVTLTVVLGSVNVPVSELMGMQRGNTIALKKKVGDPVEILANGKLIARGELVVLEEEQPVFAVSLTELIAASTAKEQ
jgi:flagellar motor switch protein FliN/FliY